VLARENERVTMLLALDERIIYEDKSHARQYILLPLEDLMETRSMGKLTETLLMSIFTKFTSTEQSAPSYDTETIQKLVEMFRKNPSESLQHFSKGSPKDQERFCKQIYEIACQYTPHLPYSAIAMFNYLKIKIPKEHVFHSIFSFRTIMEKEINDIDSPFKKKNFICGVLDSIGLVDTSDLSNLLLKTTRDYYEISDNSSAHFYRYITDVFDRYRDCFLSRVVFIQFREMFIDAAKHRKELSMCRVFEIILKSLIVDPKDVMSSMEIIFDPLFCKVVLWDSGKPSTMYQFVQYICQLLLDFFKERKFQRMLWKIDNKYPSLLQRVYLLHTHTNIFPSDHKLWWDQFFKTAFDNEPFSSIVGVKHWMFWLPDISKVGMKKNTVRNVVLGQFIENLFKSENLFLRECFIEMLSLNIQTLKNMPSELFQVLRQCNRETSLDHSIRSWFLDGLELVMKNVTTQNEILSERLAFVIYEIFDNVVLSFHPENSNYVLEAFKSLSSHVHLFISCPQLGLVFLEWAFNLCQNDEYQMNVAREIVEFIDTKVQALQLVYDMCGIAMRRWLKQFFKTNHTVEAQVIIESDDEESPIDIGELLKAKKAKR